jgi:N5-hydroxyornithine acetyltransferase
MSLNDRFQQGETAMMTDTELLNKWMNDPRVAYSWGEDGPMEHQSQFLATSLSSRHSFPAIGCFDGKPFGYFEIYWVREDRVSRLTGDRSVGDWDRGLHCLVGEQEFRGSHRVKVWLSALVHWCWLADLRTERVVMEPRVDNVKYVLVGILEVDALLTLYRLRKYCEDVGFYKEGEVTFPHKQSNFMKIRRDEWEGPAL